MLTENGYNGVFLGRSLFSVASDTGGAKNVFVKLQGEKNNIVYPTFGGRVMNPFKGAAKFFAGDLAEFRTDEKGLNPEYYLLKTYKVKSIGDVGGKQVLKLYYDRYSHIPFAGDFLMKAPEKIGGNGAASQVLSVSKYNDGGTRIWEVILADKNLTSLSDGDILVEADKAHASDANMLVKNINSVAGCDYDFLYSPVADPSEDDEFEKARYHIALQLGGLMWKDRMSPIPECVEVFNQANVNGWFEVNYKFPPALLK